MTWRGLKEGFRIGVRAMTAAKKSGVVLEVFPSGYSPRIRELLRPSTRNAAIAGVAAPLMDVSNAARKKIMAYAIGTEYTAEELAADDTLLEAHLRKRVNGTWHPCGSCRMGDPSDRMAVTDPSARVIGVDGIASVRRLADADCAVREPKCSGADDCRENRRDNPRRRITLEEDADADQGPAGQHA